MAKNNPGFELHKLNDKIETYKIRTRDRRWARIARNELDTQFPILIDVETSSQCDLNCPFCYRTMLMDKADKKSLMDFKTFKSIFKSGFSSGCKLNYYGEPLLNTELPKMIKYLHDNDTIDIMINTNGTHLTPEMSKDLIDAGITRIIISVDSIVPETYEKLRVGAKLDKVIQNIKDLIKIRGNQTYPMIRIQKIRLPATEFENQDYLDCFTNLGVDYVAFNSYKEKNPTDVNFKSESCSQPFQRILVDHNLNLHCCCSDQGNQYIIGNIKDITIRKAWTSQKMKVIQHLSRSKELYKLPCCSICDANK